MRSPRCVGKETSYILRNAHTVWQDIDVTRMYGHHSSVMEKKLLYRCI